MCSSWQDGVRVPAGRQVALPARTAEGRSALAVIAGEASGGGTVAPPGSPEEMLLSVCQVPRHPWIICNLLLSVHLPSVLRLVSPAFVGLGS